jgi:pimeloyl-ACP methyl ester carboxylesterase
MKTKEYEGIIDADLRVKLREERHWALTEDRHWLAILRRYNLIEQEQKAKKVPIVLVHGLAQNHYTWDLSERSFQNYLVSEGFDTYNVELRGHSTSRAGRSPYPKSFEEYHQLDMPAIVNEVLDISGASQVFLCGHSLGCSVIYAYSIRHQDCVAGIVSIGGPTHFGLVSLPNRLIGSGFHLLYNYLYPWPWILRQLPYVFGDLAGHFVTLNRWYFDHPKQRFPMAVWHPLAIEWHLTEERMVKGWDRTGVPVFMTLMRWFASPEGNISDDGKINYSRELNRLHVPVFFVVGNKDRVAPLHSIEPGYELCASQDKSFRVFGGDGMCDYGHIDLILGQCASKDVWPVIDEWLTNRDRNMNS